MAVDCRVTWRTACPLQGAKALIPCRCRFLGETRGWQLRLTVQCVLGRDQAAPALRRALPDVANRSQDSFAVTPDALVLFDDRLAGAGNFSS